MEQHWPFVCEEKIGHGGQAEIYRAAMKDGSGVVAVKFLKREFHDTDPRADVARRRFIREADIVRTLDHPNIVKILDRSHDTEPIPWYTMNLADSTLASEMAESEGGKIPLPRLTEVLSPVCDALDYAHSSGVVHRDLKPENILFINGEPVVSDFGIGLDLFSDETKLTRTGQFVGSPDYVAPEQLFDSHNVTQAADIYALGKILYVAATGASPGTIDINLAPSSLRRAITRATRTRPVTRPSRASEFKEMLQKAAHENDVEHLGELDYARLLVRYISRGDLEHIPDLLDLLEQPDEERDLYVNFIPTLSSALMREMYRTDQSAFSDIVTSFSHFCEYGRFDWQVTDGLADGLVNMIQVCQDYGAQTSAITALFALGKNHNRFAIARKIAALAVQMGESDAFMDTLEQIKSDMPEALTFVRANSTLARISHLEGLV